MDSRTFAILVDHCFSWIPSKSILPPPRSSTKWSSALTSEPATILTAEGLHPSRSSFTPIASGPYICGGGLYFLSQSEETLECILLGLTLICGPPALSRPSDKNINSSKNPSRPRFNYFLPSLSPIINLFCLHGLISRRLFSYREATNRIWCCEYLSRTLLSRFDWNPILPHPSQSQYSFMKPSVRRLHLDNKLLLVLGWIETFLDNLLLESSRTLAFEASNLNDLGIMIQSIRNCGYRYVFMLPSSTRLIHKPFKLPLINFLKFPLKNLKTSGIMIPIQCSGGYHNISKRFKPEPKTTTTLITIFKQSIINRVQTLGKALLRVDILNPVRFLALAFSTLRSLRSKTVAIFSSIEVFMEEASLFLDLTGSKTLARSWFIALKSTISMTLIYLYLFVVLALGIALPRCFLNFDLYVVCCVLF